MIPALALVAALSFFAGAARHPTKPAPPISRAPRDTIFVVIYKHFDYSGPMPLVVEDSLRIYSPKAMP